MAEREAAGGGSVAGGLGEVSAAIAALAAAVSALPEGEDFHFYHNFAPLRARVEALKAGAGEVLGRVRAAEWGEDAAEAHEALVDLLDDVLEGVDTALDQARKGPHDGTASLASLLHSANFGGVRAIGREAFGHRGMPSDNTERRGGQHAELPRFGSTLQPGSRQKSGWRPQDDFPVPVDNSRPSSEPLSSPLPPASEGPLPLEGPRGTPPGHPGGPALDRVAAHALRLGVTGTGTKGEGGAVLQAAKEALLRVPQKWQAFQMEVNVEQVRRDAESMSSAARRAQRLQDTPFSFVDSVEALEAAAKALEGVQEIAVDLENHSLRSFQGFLCVMQLSTRTHDFVIDTLAPAIRQHLPRLLGPVFQSPGVVKVMHGANMDIVWLQRDFGMVVANLFDTGQAARVLDLPSFGLAHLLKDICGVTANKSLQTADWRVRPLPADMLKYAREDTHYLLHIYDVLRQRLVKAPASPALPLLQVAGSGATPVKPTPERTEIGATSAAETASPPSSGERNPAEASPARGAAAGSPISPPGPPGLHPELSPGAYPAGARKVVEVLERSLSICLLEYHRPAFNPSGYLKVYDKSRLHFTEQQLSAMAVSPERVEDPASPFHFSSCVPSQALYEWRDSVARSLDESTGYVLSNHMLIRLARQLPASPAQLRALVRNSAPLVLQDSARVLALIQGAQEARAQLPGPQGRLALAPHSGLQGEPAQGATGLAPSQEAQEPPAAQGAGSTGCQSEASAAASGSRAAEAPLENEGMAASEGVHGRSMAGEGGSDPSAGGSTTGEGESTVPAPGEQANATAPSRTVQGAGVTTQAVAPRVVVSRKGSSRGALGSMLGATKKAAVRAAPAAAGHPHAAAPPEAPVPRAENPAPSVPVCTPAAKAATSNTTSLSVVRQQPSAGAGVLGSLLGSNSSPVQPGTGGGTARAEGGALQLGRNGAPEPSSKRDTASVHIVDDTMGNALRSPQAVGTAAAEGAPGPDIPRNLARGRRDRTSMAGQSGRDLQAEVLARVRLSVAGVRLSAAAHAVPANSTGAWGTPSGGEWERALGGDARPDQTPASCLSHTAAMEQGQHVDDVGGGMGDASEATAFGADSNFIAFDTGEGHSEPESGEGAEPPSRSDPEGSGAKGGHVQPSSDVEQEPGGDACVVSAVEGHEEGGPTWQGEDARQAGSPPSPAAGKEGRPLLRAAARDSCAGPASHAEASQGGAGEGRGAQAEARKAPRGHDSPCAQPKGDRAEAAEAPFDFVAARKRFNLWGSAPRKDVPQQRKGAKKRPLPPVQNGVFDPMAPLRQDSHAGPKGGKRSQVYPRSGNRSHSFRD